MTAEDLRATLDGDEPPAGLSAPLRALWYAAKGDWDRAHRISQTEETRESAWVHAYLHRVEGDLKNAGHWYGRAGKDRCETSLTEEWTTIADALS